MRRWVWIAIAIVALAAAAMLAYAMSGPPPAAPQHGMTQAEMCAHMAEHCATPSQQGSRSRVAIGG